jgi:predicted TPR repeat methyltransferase
MQNIEKTKIAIALFDKWAQQYQDRFMEFDLYNDTFDLFCQNIPQINAKILDVACGPGNITQYLLQKRPDFQILGIDLAPNMLALAQINNPTATFELQNCKEIYKIDTSFEAIICGFGLPYLSKEEAIQFIVDAKFKLKKQGVLYLSIMEDDYEKSHLDTSSSGDVLYLHYHQADYLTEALAQNGFEIMDLQRKNFPTKDGKFTKDLIIIAKKQDS